MEQFIVSARKYRPISFDSVVGQQSVSNTLKNAINNNQLAQAFLFCGPRGVGKTTCARILAKALNAADIDHLENEDGDDLNIFELDAASNNSVEDIRRLIEQVRIPPIGGKKYKTYIIDEVHMLSTNAFNAFLKTLEEPPAYAKFILATTEKHKILPTILSRCQIFDFQRISIQDMVQHLNGIAQKEQILAEQDALHIIAQKADGGLRDALSMFDQLATFTAKNITYSAVIENLNVLDYDYYFSVTQAIIEQHIPKALLLFNEISEKGFDGQHFLVGLAEHFRNLLVCKDPQTIKLLVVGDNIKQKYHEQAQVISVEHLLSGLGQLTDADINYRMSKNQRLLVELTLMQLCSLQHQEGEKKNDFTILAPSFYTDGIAAIKPLTNAPAPTVYAQTVSTNPVIAAEPSNNTTPKPETPSKQNLVKPGIPKLMSIKGLVNKPVSENSDAENNSATRTQLPEDPIEQSQLDDAWKNFTDLVKQKQKESFYSTLTNRKPVLLENFVIHFAIDNAVQKMDFEREQAELLEYIRKQLNNYSITLQLEVSKSTEKTGLYADSDKLKALMEKNDAVALLVQKFGLEPEF